MRSEEVRWLVPDVLRPLFVSGTEGEACVRLLANTVGGLLRTVLVP
jgi:hypothetical protein